MNVNWTLRSTQRKIKTSTSRSYEFKVFKRGEKTCTHSECCKEFFISQFHPKLCWHVNRKENI